MGGPGTLVPGDTEGPSTELGFWLPVLLGCDQAKRMDNRKALVGQKDFDHIQLLLIFFRLGRQSGTG